MFFSACGGIFSLFPCFSKEFVSHNATTSQSCSFSTMSIPGAVLCKSSVLNVCSWDHGTPSRTGFGFHGRLKPAKTVTALGGGSENHGFYELWKHDLIGSGNFLFLGELLLELSWSSLCISEILRDRKAAGPGSGLVSSWKL